MLCHDVLECLPDTDPFVAEAARILRPDGRLVLAHTDYDTLVFTSEDLQLTRRLVHAYCDTQQPWMDAVDGTSPYGRRGNGVVRHLGESYDNVVLTGGFSKAYSSLLAFVVCPPELKRLLKVTAPPYLYSGPSPVASLASVLVGLQVNEARGDDLRAILWARTRRILDHLEKLGAFTLNRSGFPIVGCRWPRPTTSPRPAASCSTRAST